ncbi:MAG: hypothetical protein ACF8QF_09205 [Phycisphaerales bacterium]
MRNALVIALAALAPMLGACSDGDGPGAVTADGRVDLAPGYRRATPTVYQHELATHDVQVVQLAGSTETRAEVGRRFEVSVAEARPDGAAIVRFTMRHVRFHIEPPNAEPYDFDSESNPGAEDDPIAEALRGLASLDFQAEMGADGKVIRLVDYDAARRQLRRPPDKVISFFDDAWFISALESVWQVSEGAPQRTIGESWTTTDESTLPGGDAPAVTTFTHTLTEAADGVASITGTGDMVIEWGLDAQTRGTASRIEEQAFDFSIDWSLDRGNLESMVVDSMIQYFVNYGGALDQRVTRTLTSSLRRVE